MQLRLLIIDDNPADRSLMRRLLRSSGLEADVVEVARAEEFVSQPHNSFDCILLDNRLPDGDGIDALGALSSDIVPPVIVMSGQGDEQIAARAIKSGASDYLVKDSVTPRGLARAIRNAIEKSELEKGLRQDTEAQDRALVEAERANKAKSVFLEKLSSELRSSLTSILGLTKTLSDESFGTDAESWARYKNCAADIQQDTLKLLSLLDDILDIARLSTGAAVVDIDDIRPMTVVSEVVSQWKPRADAKGVTLEVDVSEAPEAVRSDARLLRAIVASLLSNAVAYTPHGGQVSISLAGDGASWSITVSDNGIGIDPNSLQWLLRPFEDYDIGSSAQSEGLGIGLPLMQSAVDILGGEAVFDTAPGLGTAVTVTFRDTGG